MIFSFIIKILFYENVFLHFFPLKPMFCILIHVPKRDVVDSGAIAVEVNGSVDSVLDEPEHQLSDPNNKFYKLELRK